MSKSNFFFRVARIKRPRKPPFLLCCKVSDISMYSWILKHHPGFADCLWRGNLIFIFYLRQPNKYIFKLLSFKRRQYTSLLQWTINKCFTISHFTESFSYVNKIPLELLLELLETSLSVIDCPDNQATFHEGPSTH